MPGERSSEVFVLRIMSIDVRRSSPSAPYIELLVQTVHHERSFKFTDSSSSVVPSSFPTVLRLETMGIAFSTVIDSSNSRRACRARRKNTRAAKTITTVPCKIRALFMLYGGFAVEEARRASSPEIRRLVQQTKGRE